MAKIRLILKVPGTRQTSEETWQDATRFETYDLECPVGLSEQLWTESPNPWGTANSFIVGAEYIPEKEPDAGQA